MTLPGIPTIYAGDEQGFTGEKLDEPHGDDAVRPPFPATPSELSPWGAETLPVYKGLVALRRDHPWLADANLTTSDVSGTSMAVHLSKDEQHLTLALNTDDQPAHVGGLTVAPHSYATDR